jgi:hypothetical protein
MSTARRGIRERLTAPLVSYDFGVYPTPAYAGTRARHVARCAHPDPGSVPVRRAWRRGARRSTRSRTSAQRTLEGRRRTPTRSVGYDERPAQVLTREECSHPGCHRGPRAPPRWRHGGVVPATVLRDLRADRVREAGVTSGRRTPFADRRRVKSETELAGLRRAQRAARGRPPTAARGPTARAASRTCWVGRWTASRLTLRCQHGKAARDRRCLHEAG